MARYFIIKNHETLEVVSAEFEDQPENSLPYFVNSFHRPSFDKFPNPEKVIDSATDEEIAQLSETFRDQNILEAYEKRKADGWDAYQNFRKDMVKQIYDGHLTKPAAFMIEEYLGVGYDKIAQNGDWETAYYKLSQIVLPEVHAFVQPYLDSAKSIMLAYLQANYRPM